MSAPWELLVWAAAVGLAVLLVGVPIFLLVSGLHAAVARHRNLSMTLKHEQQKDLEELRARLRR